MPTKDEVQLAALLVHHELVSREEMAGIFRTLSEAEESGKEVSLRAILLERELASEAELDSMGGVPLTDIQPIPDYKLEKKIAEGGMAAVYEAVYLPLKERVALKIMKPELARLERYRRRFLREARLLEKLDHENIVHSYEIRRCEGYIFYAMEHVDGATVEERIDKDGPFGEEQALYVVRAVADALVYLHRRGVVHRDLKPGNFLLTESGDLKIIDLGLAKLPAGMVDDSEQGTTVGTVEYLSPEQARGLEDVDGRSDIYSLGVSLFHMVVGEVPFKGESNQEVIAKQVLATLRSPVLKSRKVSAHTHYFIQRMMAKDRGDRFQTAEEILKEIDEKVGDVSTAFRPEPAPEATERPVLEIRPRSRRQGPTTRRRRRGGRRTGPGRRRRR